MSRPSSAEQAAVRAFHERLLRWFEAHGRHDLPWQRPRTLYRVWVSEIMLQQTQVVTVIGYFERFMRRFPTVQSLASAPLDEVLAHWSGLGYYARARHLHRAAQLIVASGRAQWPRTREGWTALPGVGESTAGAILAQALNQREPILDGNVKRVLTRVFAVAEPVTQAVDRLWELADRITPLERPADFTQAIMDLGATVCTLRRPLCERCPLSASCAGFKQGDPTRYPVKSKAKAKRQVVKWWLILRTERAVYLEQRPAQGIWGGLWGFKEFESHRALLAFVEQVPKGDSGALKPVAAKKHVLSHQTWDIHCFELKLLKKPTRLLPGSWVAHSDRDQRGLAAPVAAILKAMV